MLVDESSRRRGDRARQGGAREAVLDHMLTGQIVEAFYVFVTLIAMLNPIEAAAAFATLTEGRTAGPGPELRRGRRSSPASRWLVRFHGEALLGALGVEMGAFKIAGGLLLLKVGSTWSSPSRPTAQTADNAKQPRARSDPSVFPLAIPIITGPGALTASVALVNPGETQQYLNGGIFIIVALIVIAITYGFMRGAQTLTRGLAKPEWTRSEESWESSLRQSRCNS